MVLQSFSFFDGTLNREKVKKLVQEPGKTLLYTFGLSYRHPSTYREPITVEGALKVIDTESLLDVDVEEDNVIHLNAYSGNDMW